MSYIHNVYIADGFLDDCDELIHKCVQQGTVDFQSFCSIWQEMNFGCIYQGRSTGAEVAELSEEVLQVAKHYMVSNISNYEESVAGLFLVYALMNLQPYKGFAALRLVPDDVAAVVHLEMVARRERRLDVLYILGSVLIKGPCHYHAAQRERGLEARIRKYLDGYDSIDNSRSNILKGVFSKQNNVLDIIKSWDYLTKQYMETKNSLTIAGTSYSDKNLRYIDENLPSELDRSLRRIINGRTAETNEDNDNSLSCDRHNSVQAIKMKAVHGMVKPMRHLALLENRENDGSNYDPEKSGIKSKPGKVKSGSPKKPISSYLSKTQNDLLVKGRKRRFNTDKKDKLSDSSDDDLNLEDFNKETVIEENKIKDGSDDDESEQKFTQVVENELCDINIDNLPSVFTTEDQGKVFEIQVINEYEGNNHDDSKDVKNIKMICTDETQSTTDEGPSASRNENDKNIYETNIETGQDDENISDTYIAPRVKKMEKRDLKRSNIKSKFKRQGLLPVANFEERK